MNSAPHNADNNITFYIDDTPIELIYVEGTDENGFIMGGESGYKDTLPEHPVCLSSYYIGKYPVTQALWEKIMGKEANTAHFQGDKNRPMENISYEDITKKEGFINKLNKNAQIQKQIAENEILNNIFKEKETSQFSFDLPSEAQWEYAAHARTEKYKYAGSDNIHEVAWYDKNSHSETKPVGLKKPNGLGIYDMSGNLLEWCKDWYDAEYYKKCLAE